MTTITTRTLNSVKPKSAPYFIRDNRVTGFAVKVKPLWLNDAHYWNLA